MKKRGFSGFLFLIALIGISILAGCQKTEPQEEAINLKDKTIFKLNAFEENGVKSRDLTLEGFFERPEFIYCDSRDLVIKKGTKTGAVDQADSEKIAWKDQEILENLETLLTRNPNRDYEISSPSEFERVVNIPIRKVFPSDFPLFLHNYIDFSGSIEIVNFETKLSGNTLILNTIKNPELSSYLIIDSDLYHRNELNIFNTATKEQRSIRVDDHVVVQIERGGAASLLGFSINHKKGKSNHEFPSLSPDYKHCRINSTTSTPPILKIHKNIPYSLTFDAVHTGITLDKAKLIKIEEKKSENNRPIETFFSQYKDKLLNTSTIKPWGSGFYKEIPLKLDSKARKINFSVPDDGKYMLLVIEKQASYLSYFEALKPGEGIHVKDDPNTMVLKISSQYLLTGENLTGQLKAILGSGNFSFSLQNDENNTKYDEEEEDTTNDTLKDFGSVSQITINYFIEPNQHFTGTLKILDLDGIEHSVAVDFFVEHIPDARISQDLFSQKLNVLPSEGYWSNKIKIGTKNTKTITLYTQACDLTIKGDFSDQKREELLPPLKNKKRRDYDYRSTTTELHFFDCKDKIQEHTIPIKDFQYRKRTNFERTLPEMLQKTPYFRISFEKDMQNASYYMRSPIGLFAKIEPKKALHLRATDYHLGEMVTGGTVKVYNQEGKLLYTETMKKEGITIALKEDNELYLIHYENQNPSNREKSESFLLINQDGRASHERSEITSWLNPTATDQDNSDRGERPIKIYGYTDRGLYKPGDTVYFAGFVRNVDNKEEIVPLTGFVIVKFMRRGNNGQEEIGKVVIESLDRFGGFEGSFELSDEEPLQYKSIEFIYTKDLNKTSYMDFGEDRKAWDQYKETGKFASFATDINVQEFQKSAFSTEIKKEIKDHTAYLELTPTYYMGGAVKDYNLSLEYTLTSKQDMRDYRRKKTSDFYYNYVIHQPFASYGDFEKNNIKDGAIVLELGDLSKRGYKGNALTLKMQTTVKDNLSDEVHNYIEYIDIEPEIKIGLDGYPYDWMNTTMLKTYRITGKMEEQNNKSDHLSYERYFRPFGFTQEVDTEGTYYYINGNATQLIQSGTLPKKSDFEIPLFFEQYGGGEYILKVISKDKNGIINGEVDKNIYYYDGSGENDFQGNMSNNYSLQVHIPKTEYQPGDSIPITIDPYIKGATALITVEKGEKILEKQIIALQGQALSIPAKEDYYPNAHISVTLFVGEEINTTLGEKSQKRKEPAFFAGYGELLMQEKLKTINIELITDKDDYQPGETVKVKILTKDYTGKPITARISLSVVDKALSDLYDTIKAPIPYFYNRLGSEIGNFSNWKNLYYALRTFFANGEKGGGGNGEGNLQNLRKKFYDLAYRNAAIITTGGKAEISFEVPDNLTTWMLDAVAISPELKLGTERAYFKVNQSLVIEANLPTFISIGDQLKLPLKVLANEKIGKKTPITIEGAIKTEKGKILNTFKQETLGNSKISIPLSTNDSVFDDNYLIVSVSAKAGTFQDAAEWKIPIRTAGLINKSFLLTHKKEGNYQFNFEGKATRGEIIARLSSFPITVIAEPFEYLLNSYSDHSESIIRVAQSALEAKKLQQLKLLSGDFIQGNEIIFKHGEKKSIEKILENTLIQLSQRQNRDGSINAWENQENNWPWEKEKSINPELSIATFGLLESMQEQGFGKLIPSTFKSKLSEYLEQFGNSNPELYLYYLAQKKTNLQSINIPLIQRIKSQHPQNIAVQTLAFALLANQQDQKTLLNDVEQTALLFEHAFKQGKYFEYKIMDLRSLQAYYLQGLIKAYERFPQQQQIEDHLTMEIQSLLKARESYGLWSRSYRTNFLILETLNLALNKYYLKQAPEVTCSLIIDNQTKEVSTNTGSYAEIKLPFEQKDAISLDWKCSGSAFLDYEVKYLLEDISQKKEELHHVENLKLHVPQKDTIGDLLELQAQFKIEQEAKDLVVEFNIPSELKLFANTTKGVGDEYGKLEGNGERSCFPDHQEFRFDRVILYYDHLKAGKQCAFTFSAIKAFDGSFILPPSKLYESHTTEVWGVSQALAR